MVELRLQVFGQLFIKITWTC